MRRFRAIYTDDGWGDAPLVQRVEFAVERRNFDAKEGR